LTSFYFDTRYPGDNYTNDIDESQVENALLYADILKEYYENELLKLSEATTKEIKALDNLKPSS